MFQAIFAKFAPLHEASAFMEKSLTELIGHPPLEVSLAFAVVVISVWFMTKLPKVRFVFMFQLTACIDSTEHPLTSFPLLYRLSRHLAHLVLSRLLLKRPIAIVAEFA